MQSRLIDGDQARGYIGLAVGVMPLDRTGDRIASPTENAIPSHLIIGGSGPVTADLGNYSDLLILCAIRSARQAMT